MSSGGCAILSPVDRIAHTEQDAEVLPLTTCLTNQPLERKAEAGVAIERFLESDAWPALSDALALHINDLQQEWLNPEKPLEDRADHELLRGRIKGLRDIPSLIAGIKEVGREAQAELRSDT
jgi:hypothetical protein